MVQPRTAVQLLQGDLTPCFAESLRTAGEVAWDTETTGLDWHTGHLATCQLFSPTSGAMVVRMDGSYPNELAGLLADPAVTKVFHHAPFDLRFMSSAWKVLPSNVVCTKIASKLLHPERHNGEHSLKPILKEYLDVSLDKSEQVSNWLASTLTRSQIDYAVRDVQFLLPLFETLAQKLRQRGLWDLALRCFEFLPAQVQLDILGYSDVFQY